MNARRALVRKVGYLVAMGVLLVPLFWLGHPATFATKEGQGRSGGVLAQIRQAKQVSQTDLGQIDLTAETVKLATLGMRGVAADILWMKANKFQMKKDWTNLSATLEQITKVEPNLIGPWRFQAWNLSYNVSVSFDLPGDKYYWLIRGVRFLEDGVWHNKREPRLLTDIGWFISYKIGKDDPWRQYRRLFRQDDDFNGSLPLELRDNWLVGKTWYEKSEDLVKGLRREDLGTMSMVLFYHNRPMCQMDYADTMEKEGIFGEKARLAWQVAGHEWFDFGAREIPSPIPDEGPICLNRKERYDKEAHDLLTQLESLSPGVRERILRKNRAALTPQERKILDTPAEKRSPQQNSAARDLEEKIRVTPHAIALQIGGRKHKQARELADKIDDCQRQSVAIARDRTIVNFDYWKLRAQVEQTPDLRNARKYIYQADRDFAKAYLDGARSNYDLGFSAWRKVLDRFPELKSNRTTPADIMDVIKRYEALLKRRDDNFPKPFILQDIIDVSPKGR